jgi:hypothetical protein
LLKPQHLRLLSLQSLGSLQDFLVPLTLPLQFLLQSLMLLLQMSSPFFLRMFGLLLSRKALLSFCLKIFYQFLALLP